jgi:thiol-disulfide isomerase/thioredoxin
MIQKKYRHVRLMLLLLSMGWLLIACNSSESAKPSESVSIGKPLPAIQMLSISGKITDSKSLFADKVVVFNLWATWCPPCRKEMPDLVHLSELLPKDKFLIVGLSIDNNLEDVQSYINEMEIPFQMFWDNGGQQVAAPILKAFRIPETFVLNREGVLVNKVTGFLPWDSPEIIAVLKNIHRTGKVPNPDESLTTLTTGGMASG